MARYKIATGFAQFETQPITILDQAHVPNGSLLLIRSKNGKLDIVPCLCCCRQTVGNHHEAIDWRRVIGVVGVEVTP